MSLNCFCFPNYFICILFLQLSNSFLALPQKHEESWKLSLYKRFSIFHFHPSMLLKYTSYHNAIHVLLILCEGRICINPFKNYNEFHIFFKKIRWTLVPILVLLILCEGRTCIYPFKNYNEFHIFLKKNRWTLVPPNLLSLGNTLLII